MIENVTLKSGHPLVGTWSDADREYGTSVQFTIRAAGANVEVTGLDTRDGEKLSLSNIRCDGRLLRFDSLVPSSAHRVEYVFEVVSPSELRVSYTTCERWVRAAP